MDATPTGDTVATQNAHIDPRGPSTSTSASDSNPRVIDHLSAARDLEREVSHSDHGQQARNSEHQLSAGQLPEDITTYSDSEAGAHIASLGRHIRRRLSSTMITGLGSNYATDSARSWTRAG